MCRMSGCVLVALCLLIPRSLSAQTCAERLTAIQAASTALGAATLATFGPAYAALNAAIVAATTTCTVLPPPPPPVAGYKGEYWNAGTGPAPAIPTTAPVLIRQDAEINFTWGAGAPGPGINPDHFVVRWTQTVTFPGGTYMFSATADDGIRVFVDGGAAIIDQWHDGSATAYSASLTLTAGSHVVRVEYYDDLGGATAKLSWLLTAPTAQIKVNEAKTFAFDHDGVNAVGYRLKDGSVVKVDLPKATAYANGVVTLPLPAGFATVGPHVLTATAYNVCVPSSTVTCPPASTLEAAGPPLTVTVVP